MKNSPQRRVSVDEMEQVPDVLPVKTVHQVVVLERFDPVFVFRQNPVIESLLIRLPMLVVFRLLRDGVPFGKNIAGFLCVAK